MAISVENVRKLVISQLSFLNTLSIQIDNDLRKWEELDVNECAYVYPDEITRIQTLLMNSIYQRSRLIQRQLIDLKDWVKMVDIPDGKLIMHLGIAIKTATVCIDNIRLLCDDYQLIDKGLDCTDADK